MAVEGRLRKPERRPECRRGFPAPLGQGLEAGGGLAVFAFCLQLLLHSELPF